MRSLLIIAVLLLSSVAVADEEKLTREEKLEGENIALSQQVLRTQIEKLQQEIQAQDKALTARASALNGELAKKYKLSGDDKADFAKGVIVRAKKATKK